ncbi:hypothetical protein [Pseudoneobacillus sp. C159]
MKFRMVGIALALWLSASLVGCDGAISVSQVAKEGKGQESENPENVIKRLVLDFGQTLQNVSLLSPKDIVRKSMQENYGKFVSQTLLEKWQNDPENAPGRLVSSPWPDRIEIESIHKRSETNYEIKGSIIESTNDNNNVAKRSITLDVNKVNQKWLIEGVTLGDYAQAENVIYKNTQYGFDFSLPGTWKDYSIVKDKWEGLGWKGTEGEKVVATGPMLIIRHPKWTTKVPRQDIPIMIFTLEQWNSLQKEDFHIGAAPIGPKELGRNSKYVFALPARYNFAFLEGYQEVENILNNQPLQPTENIH